MTAHSSPVEPRRATSPRSSAADRRGQLVRAAVIEFSVRGLDGTSTAGIARRAGVSQPYLYRLFPTKKDLFIAACEHNADQVIDALTRAAQSHYRYEGPALGSVSPGAK